ncbi:MAG: hypothetical protein PHG91_01525 [Syntrophales bacterium]|nr:hypothetical protein [Syntrophales bacterium]MDD5232052.1 hypothetical protein [Syntrophales bacterium]MDD5532519.1 hypothetical protein [Syntrophales bacterium]
MFHIETRTNLSPEECAKKLRHYFGTEGLGLKLVEECPGRLRFEGGGGFVEAEICTSGKATSVNLITREWDYHVRKFLTLLKS